MENATPEAVSVDVAGDPEHFVADTPDNSSMQSITVSMFDPAPVLALQPAALQPVVLPVDLPALAEESSEDEEDCGESDDESYEEDLSRSSPGEHPDANTATATASSEPVAKRAAVAAGPLEDHPVAQGQPGPSVDEPAVEPPKPMTALEQACSSAERFVEMSSPNTPVQPAPLVDFKTGDYVTFRPRWSTQALHGTVREVIYETHVTSLERRVQSKSFDGIPSAEKHVVPSGSKFVLGMTTPHHVGDVVEVGVTCYGSLATAIRDLIHIGTATYQWDQTTVPATVTHQEKVLTIVEQGRDVSRRSENGEFVDREWACRGEAYPGVPWANVSHNKA